MDEKWDLRPIRPWGPFRYVVLDEVYLTESKVQTIQVANVTSIEYDLDKPGNVIPESARVFYGEGKYCVLKGIARAHHQVPIQEIFIRTVPVSDEEFADIARRPEYAG